MIDHTGIVVSDFERSKSFYSATLTVLGLSLVAEYPASMTGNTDTAGFGLPSNSEVSISPEFWISQGTLSFPLVHVAFRVESRSLVEAFYNAALAAGGRDNGAPGLRPQYHPNYYAAFVLDPDGHNIETVCREPT